ncbi:MAG: thioredoxin family protein, partial [Candidatus Cryptobacteroides sp.]
AFALPFTVFALFPSLLNKLKSGSWLSSVKVVLGFIEVALGFKFLSVADQTYHWGLLDREVYLAIWIVVFSMLGFYLLGKLRFPHDEKVEHISLVRLVSSIAVFSFVVYMIPGMFGAPLKALSGYLPPISTQDFVLGSAPAVPASATVETANPYNLKMPYGMKGYFRIEDAVEAARKSGKPIFVDVTGHGCVNCREMEARVWSDPEVMSILTDSFEMVALYVDDKTKLREEDWVHAANGDVYKDVGRANAYIARERFGVNSQPNYILLDPDGNQIAAPRGYNLDVEGFKNFLRQALDNR